MILVVTIFLIITITKALDLNFCLDLIGNKKRFLNNEQYFTYKNIENYIIIKDCLNKFEFNKIVFKNNYLNDLESIDDITKFIDNLNIYKKIVIYGENIIDRTSNEYVNIAILSKKLSELGYLLISNGIEAVHLGTWFCNRSIEQLYDGINILKGNDINNLKILYPKVSNNIDLLIIDFKSKNIITPFASYIVNFFNNVLLKKIIIKLNDVLIFRKDNINKMLVTSIQNNILLKSKIEDIVYEIYISK
jgi:hypothetical protein